MPSLSAHVRLARDGRARMWPGMRAKTLRTISGEANRLTTHPSQNETYSTGKAETQMPLESELLSSAGNCGSQRQSSSAGSLQSGNHSEAAGSSPGLLESALVPCVYIALRCSLCGELRQALTNLPASTNVLCPECGRSCCFVTLGRGLTKSQLPFYEIHTREKPRLNFQGADENSSP